MADDAGQPPGVASDASAGRDAASGSTDAGHDAGSVMQPEVDAGRDAGIDAGSMPPHVPDAGSDFDATVTPSVPDAAVDAGAIADAAPQPSMDGGSDAGVDAGSDATVDAGSIPAPGVDPRLDDDDRTDDDMGPPTPAPVACTVQVSAGASKLNPAFSAEPSELTGWTTFQGGPEHSGWVPISLDPTRFEPRWTFEDFGRELSALTVDQGIVALASGGPKSAYRPIDVLHTLSVQSGRVLWTYNAVLEDRVGPPAIKDGVVFAQVGAENWAHVVAFDALNGSHLWRTPFDTQWPDFLSPTIDGDQMLMGGGEYGGMYAFDRTTGAQQWFVQLPQVEGFTPTPRAQDVVAMVGDSLHVIDRVTGEMLQEIKHPALKSSMQAALPVETGATTFVAVASGQLFTFDLGAGKVSWTLQGSFSGQPVVAATELYVRNGNALDVRDAATGELHWSWSPEQGSIGEQIIVTDNLAFVTTDAATMAVDLATHQSVWSYPETGRLTLGQGTLFISGTTRLSAIDMLGDSDQDGLADWWELHQAGGDMDPAADPDSDGLDNAQELSRDTVPGCADSDGDGLFDGLEVQLGLNAISPDSDGDGLSDGREVQHDASNALLVDSDADGIADDLETKAGLDPTNAQDALADQDGDGYVDGHEALARTDPRDARSFPQPKNWGMHQGNARHDGYQPLWLDAARFTPSWSATLDEDILGVAVGERHVVATTHLTEVVFDADDGTERWRFRQAVLGPDGYSSWTQNSPPSLYAGNVYVHSAESLAATLWSRNARTGELQYRRYHGNQDQGFLAPTLFDGRVHMDGGYYGGLITADARTGDTLWTLAKPQGFGTWEPAVTSNGLWLVDESYALHGYDRTSGAEGNVADPRLTFLSPVLDRDGNAYMGATAGFYGGEVVTAVHRASGKLRWTSEHGPVGKHGEPSVGNYRVYALQNGALHVYHPETGRRLWSFQPDSDTLSSNVVVTASHAFVASTTATYAIDLRTHTQSYRYPLGGQLAIGPEANLVIFSSARIDVITLEGDVDGDGIAQWWERARGHDVSAQDDDDGDGLDALGEFRAETDPARADSDGDRLSDGEEAASGALPLASDSDGDTLPDGREVHQLHTNPSSSDSDGDGIPDAAEVHARLNPNDADDAAADLDGDGFSNRHEALAGSDPRVATSTPDLHDWAMFRGAPDHASAQLLALDPAHFETAWSYTFPSGTTNYGISSAAIDEEHVYISGDGQLRALSVTDGSEVWSSALAQVCSPSVGGGLVYVHNAGGLASLSAFDRLNGAPVFSTPHSSEAYSYDAPTLSDGVLMAPAGNGGGMIAVDAFDGKRLWEMSGGSTWEAWEPTLHHDLAYTFVHASMRGYDALTGRQLYDVTPERALTSTRYRTATTLALGQSGVLVAGGFDSLVAFNAADGKERWRTPPSGADFGLAAVAVGRVYAVRHGMLEVFDEKTGKSLWTFQPDDYLPPDNVIVTATHVFVSGAHTTYAVDLNTHQEVWHVGLGGELALSAQGLLVINMGRGLTALRLAP